LKETDALKKWGPLIKFVLGILTLAAKAAASAVSAAGSYTSCFFECLKSCMAVGYSPDVSAFDPFPAFWIRTLCVLQLVPGLGSMVPGLHLLFNFDDENAVDKAVDNVQDSFGSVCDTLLASIDEVGPHAESAESKEPSIETWKVRCSLHVANC
jgi:hypothetical protein